MQSGEILDVILVTHVEVYFSIFCSAKKTLMSCAALPSRSCMDPEVSMLQEHGAIPGRILRCHCMGSKVETSMVCSATPQELLSARASLVPCRDCPVTHRGSAVCHCQCPGVTFLPHTQAWPAGSLRLGED